MTLSTTAARRLASCTFHRLLVVESVLKGLPSANPAIAIVTARRASVLTHDDKALSVRCSDSA